MTDASDSSTSRSDRPRERPEKVSATKSNGEQKYAVALGKAVSSTTETGSIQSRSRSLSLSNCKGAKLKKCTDGKNNLAHLLPGFTAPMRLETNSLQGVAGASIAELRIRAALGEAKVLTPPISILNKNQAALGPKFGMRKTYSAKKRSKGGGRVPTSFLPSFRKAPRKQCDDTAGSGWFGMAPSAMTDQLKTDLNLISRRNYLDPKKFYKSADRFEGKVLQVGTVIEGSAEFYSSRLAKRDRRQNLTEEIMADTAISGYAKRKYGEVQEEKFKPKGKKIRRKRR